MLLIDVVVIEREEDDAVEKCVLLEGSIDEEVAVVLGMSDEFGVVILDPDVVELEEVEEVEELVTTVQGRVVSVETLLLVVVVVVEVAALVVKVTP
jgi:hypothetical protein